MRNEDILFADSMLNESSGGRFTNLVLGGYIAADGTPLRCDECESTELEETEKYFDEGFLAEYTVVCEKCGKNLGTWSYGNWLV